MQKKLIECVPNFSEGRDMSIINQITAEIEKIEGVQLLDVDPGKATNRTVVTFVGDLENTVEAAYQAIKKASELIDMSNHSGEHPRMGATDVCPFIPVSNVTMEEAAACAKKLGERVGDNLNIPIYLYESAASQPDRTNLATVRAGEYEGLSKKLADPNWKPDYGPSTHNESAGATAIGARDFLVAYNVNLNTKSVRRANSVAFDIREKGRVKREGNPITGKIVNDANGEPMRDLGSCKSVKAIGWYIEEYGLAQISMNITNINDTSLHKAFEECRKSANNRGMRVTGSELVGLVPLKVMLDAGRYFLELQARSTGVSENELIHIAIKSLGLDELGSFDPNKKIIERVLAAADSRPLMNMKLDEFADETASDSPAPGGGSISAYCGTLGIALGVMVANLSAGKRGWDDKIEFFSKWANVGQEIKQRLEFLVDEDTNAFNKIIDAVRLPKSNEAEKAARKQAMDDATKYAIDIPLEVMRTSYKSYEMLDHMVTAGNPNSISDAGVGALCSHTAIHGAYLNVKINCDGFDDTAFVEKSLKEANSIFESSKSTLEKIIKNVEASIS
jgi:glutamate formiminotransferase/formiminotetrahydrofolate cyclodeaminase